MPKPARKPPTDPAKAAKSILDQITGDEPRIEPHEKSEAAASLGSRGGKARAKALDPAEKARIARAAANARWGKPRRGD